MGEESGGKKNSPHFWQLVAPEAEDQVPMAQAEYPSAMLPTAMLLYMNVDA